MRAPFRALAFAIAWPAAAGCASHVPAADDPALRVGPLQIGEAEPRAVRALGPGTAGRWRDESGTLRGVRLYRSGDALLGLAFADGRLIDIEAYANAGRVAHGVFTFDAPDVAHVGGGPIAAYAWLAKPVFSGDLPQPPAGWHLPTDFTVTQQDVPFVMTSDDRTHLASKQRSRTLGWVLSVH